MTTFGLSDYERKRLDVDAYIESIKVAGARGHCFICDIAAGRNEQHRVVYRDDMCVAFFNRYPRMVGYLLVAPLEHLTCVVNDFSEAEYLALQSRIRRIGIALTKAVPTERLYIFCFGSMQAISHVHWHLAPLPPGVPFERQQFAAVDRPDYLDIPDEAVRELAGRIRSLIEAG